MKFEIRRSSSNTQPYYWRMVASNGQVLATSETYVAKASAMAAISSVKVYAATATTTDYT